MDSLAAADEAPIGAFGRSRVGEAGEPGEWHDDGAAVGEIYGEGVIGDVDALRRGPPSVQVLKNVGHANSICVIPRLPAQAAETLRSRLGRARKRVSRSNQAGRHDQARTHSLSALLSPTLNTACVVTPDFGNSAADPCFIRAQAPFAG